MMGRHMEQERRLGIVVRGSRSAGLEARLDGAGSVEDMCVGKFVKVRGEKHDFFCLITDVALGASNEQVLADPPREGAPSLRQVLAGPPTFGLIQVQPMLMLARDGEAAEVEVAGPQPVKT